MDSQDLKTTLAEMAAETFCVTSQEVINAPVFADLGIDSLDFVDFILQVESHYDITIPEAEMKSLWTIDLVVNCVQSKL